MTSPLTRRVAVFVAAAGGGIGGAAVSGWVPGGRVILACVEGQLARGVVVVPTADSLRAVWPALAPHSCSDTAPPRVAFGRVGVLVVAYGPHTSSGGAVGIDSVARRGDTAVVYAAWRGYGDGCPAPDDITSPTAAVAVAAPVGPVRLVGRDAPRRACR